MNYPENCGYCKYMKLGWYQVHKKEMPTCTFGLKKQITKRSNVCCSFIPDYKAITSNA